MAKLHCCLAGFDAPDALQVESLAGLVRSRMSAEWSFSTGDADACDLLLCNLDSALGAAAWQDSARRNGARAAATDGTATSGGLVLVKPLQVHGPGSLVHVLNEAAQLVTALAAPGPAASRPAVPNPARPAPAKPGGLRSFLRAIPAWLSGPGASPPASHPVQTTAPPASILSVEDGAEPAPRAQDILVPDNPPQSRLANLGLAAPTLAAAGVLELYEPERQPAPRASPATSGNVVVLDAMGCDLLGLLRRARAASQVIVVRLSGIPAICASPATDMGYTFATLQAVFDCPAAALAPTQVTVARNSYHGRVEVQPTDHGPSVSVPGFPLKNLFWVAILRCGGTDEAARYRDGAFKLLAWPDLPSLPHVRHHLTWCGQLARRPMTAAALSEAAGHDVDEAAIFLAACDELGILTRKELPSGPAPAPAAPSSRATERASVLRSILNRLGLQRP